jgi:hypothetical protein
MIKRKHIKQWQAEGHLEVELKSRDLAFGHFTYAEISPFVQPGDKVITWVREPVSRVYSNYQFFMAGLSDPDRNPEQFHINRHRKEETLLEYAQREENRNRISQFLVGIEPEELDFIGLLENMDLDIQRLGKLLDMDLAPGPVLNRGRGDSEGLTAEERRLLTSLNADDIRLYERIKDIRRDGLV